LNGLSNILVTLSQEVLSLCEQHHIPCILSDETAHAIIENDYKLEDITSIQLLIRTDDFDKLFNLLDTTSIPNRGVECMKNNDLYPTFSMYYVDTNTSYYLGDSNYLYQNAGIHILPLRKTLNEFQKRFYPYFEHWRLGMGKKVYPKLLSVYKIGSNRKAFLQCSEQDCFYYSVDELFGGNRIFASGISFPVSSLLPEWDRVSCELTQISGICVDAVLAPIPQNRKKETLARILMQRCIEVAKVRTYPVNKDWTKLQCVNDRLVLKDYYEKKLPLIRELVKNQDTERLKEELLLYHKKLCLNYRSCKITIKFDEEIFDIYQRVYLTDVKRSYVRALTRHIPKVWR